MTSVDGLLWRFGRFSLVGFIGSLLQLALMFLLTKLFGVVVMIATPVAVEITVLHNFIWHELFTWGDRGIQDPRQIAIRLCRFHAGNGLVSLGGNTILMYGLVERLHAPVVPSAMGAILLCSLVNFLLADRWVYPTFRGQSRMPQTSDVKAPGRSSNWL
jgi:putative flippase GtrA